jgi:hypothetical protein
VGNRSPRELVYREVGRVDRSVEGERGLVGDEG